jgi:DNA polymerase-3 subunit epsilon
MDFIALDIETANSDLASICSVGLIHFRNGEPFKTFSFLVDPEDAFDFMNISIHGIEPDDVAGKPTMREIFPMISSTLSSFVIAHHTAFDRVALARAAAKYGFPELRLNWLDTARRTPRMGEICLWRLWPRKSGA